MIRTGFRGSLESLARPSVAHPESWGSRPRYSRLSSFLALHLNKMKVCGLVNLNLLHRPDEFDGVFMVEHCERVMRHNRAAEIKSALPTTAALSLCCYIPDLLLLVVRLIKSS